MTSRAGELVEALTGVSAHFTRRATRQKVEWLDRLAEMEIREPRVLLSLHETLCFLQAYPDDARVLAKVTRALERVPARVKRLGRARGRLRDTGIAGTALDYPFGYPMARWLARRFPRDVDVLWTRFSEHERLEESLLLLLHRTEHDAWSDEGGLGWRRWLDAARAGRDLTDLGVVLELFDRASLGETTRDWLFESLGLPVDWELSTLAGSRTGARLQWARPVFHGALDPPLRRPDHREFIALIRRPLPSLRKAPAPLAARLIEAARLAMATRLRELFAFSHANPDDVLVADPGRGLRIALIGILPRFRLAFEGYYAYLALKNGVPVGYGGGWQLFDAIEIGVNAFEAFRRGESAFVLSQVLRAYHQAFGIRQAVVDPYQIGRGNREALRSGAFYFYYRLGFRPRDPSVRRLAVDEENKIRRDARYRSSASILARLARSEMSLSIGPAAPEQRITASQLAVLVSADVTRRFRGDRRAAARAAAATVGRALGAMQRRRWPANERRAFEELSLVIALIPDLARWPAGDRRRLVRVLRARGGPSERAYVRLLDGHRRLRRSLRALVTASGGDGHE
jgi:hypothetical protein